MENTISTLSSTAADGMGSSEPDLVQPSSNDEHKKATRKRTSSGRFMSADGCDPAEATRRKRRAFLNMETGTKLFEQLLDVVFLQGTSDDWIPGLANSGPLFVIAERLMKKSYLPSAAFRLRMTLNRHFNDDLEKQQKHLPSLWVKPAERTNQQGFRVRVFKARRLPRLSRQATEIKNVMRWVEKAESLSVLKPSSAEEAYEVLRQILSSYKCCEDGKWRYEGYPSEKVEIKGGDGGDGHVSADYGTQDTGAGPQKGTEKNDVDSTGTKQEAVEAANDVQRLVNRLDAERVLNIVQNDRLFSLICMLGCDEDATKNSETIRALVLKERDAGVTADGILENALLYAILRGQGQEESTAGEADEVRKRLQENIEMLKSYRKRLQLG